MLQIVYWRLVRTPAAIPCWVYCWACECWKVKSTREATMVIRALLKRNTYYDSITLMSVAQAAKDLPGVDDFGAVMATEVNLELLQNADLLPVAFLAEQQAPPGPEDLLIVVRAI